VIESRKQQLLQRAAALMGQTELAKRLNVSEPLLDAWMQGKAEMPASNLTLLARVMIKWAEDGHPS
jgi:DNA-binding transcriptional regulator YiaG